MRGQSGSSADLSEVGGEMSRVVVSVGAIERGRVPSLPLRLALSKERAIFAVNVRCLVLRGVRGQKGSRKPGVWEGGDVRAETCSTLIVCCRVRAR